MHTYYWIEILLEDGDTIYWGPYLRYMDASEVMLDHTHAIVCFGNHLQIKTVCIAEKFFSEDGVWKTIAIRGQDIRGKS